MKSTLQYYKLKVIPGTSYISYHTISYAHYQWVLVLICISDLYRYDVVVICIGTMSYIKGED